jgi:hypothetical protein
VATAAIAAENVGRIIGRHGGNDRYDGQFDRDD